MKYALIFAMLAGAGFFVYKIAYGGSSAYRTYEKFAYALLFDRWDEARNLATGDDVLALIEKRESTPRIIGYETYRNIKGQVHWGPVRSVQSEVTSAGGKKVTLEVIQEERAGSLTMPPVGPPTVRHTQNVVLVETAGGWKVEEFDEELDDLTDR